MEGRRVFDELNIEENLIAGPIPIPRDDVLATIVAEVLGVDTGLIRCVTGDTGITPIDLGSYSSRVTIMMGNAALQAAERVRRPWPKPPRSRSAFRPIAWCSRRDGCSRPRIRTRA